MSNHTGAFTPSLGLSRTQSLQLYDDALLPDRAIRILILHPGTRDDPIICSLERGTLRDQANTYEALSYAWGLESAHEYISCNGLDLVVRPNLAAAFRQLRRAETDRRLWVDFLCINQDDPTERGRQVACMYDIYAQSSQVLLWLGEAANDSARVMGYMDRLNAAEEVAEHARWRSRQRVFEPRAHVLEDEPPLEADNNSDSEVASLGHPSWPEAVGSFLARPWFRRFWVQQEASACHCTTVMCGRDEVPWDNLFALAWRMMRGRGQFTSGIAKKLRAIPREATISLHLIRLIHTNRQRSKASLLYVLHSARKCETTDPRDRIYSIQHLARQGKISAVLLEPDYSMPMRELCVLFARRYIEQRGLAILAFAGRASQDPSRARYLPSWVPDWENTKRHHFMGPSKEQAGGGKLGSMRIDVDRRPDCHSLFVPGHLFSQLEELSGVISDPVTTDNNDIGSVAHLSDLACLEQKTFERFVENPSARYRGTRDSWREAYAKTITANSLPKLAGHPPIGKQCRQWQDSLRKSIVDVNHNDMTDGLAASAGGLNLGNVALQHSEPISSTNSEEGDVVEALSFEQSGEADEDMYTARVHSVYALNVQKTGTYIRMQLGRASGGFLAIVPCEAQVGDHICIVQGFARTLVVRSAVATDSTNAYNGEAAASMPHDDIDTDGNVYEIIGECYVHGTNKGEVIPKSDSHDMLIQTPAWDQLEFI